MIAATLASWIAAVIATGFVLALRRAAHDRGEAVARACHELRGPITAARLGLSLAQRPGELSAARLQAIDAELRCAAFVLDDLTVARGGVPATLGLRDPGPIDVDRLVADVVWSAQGRACAAGVLLSDQTRATEATVWGDRVRLQQALANLVANAIEHGRGPVRVRASRRGGAVRIEVRDAGSGPPAPVVALAARPRAGRGERGRGLAIALSIAERHGGTITAAPTDDGARIVLELPAARPGAADRPSPPGRARR